MPTAGDAPLDPSPDPSPLTAPILVVGPPSSGQVAMRESLLTAPGTWRSEGLERLVGELAPRATADDDRRAAAPGREVAEALRRALVEEYRDAERPTLPGDARPRMVAAHPVQALWVPFLGAVFPDARFVYLDRDPVAATADALAEWRSGEAVSHGDLPGWTGPAWSLPLVPGWADLNGRPLAEVAAAQWHRIAEIARDDLERLPAGRWRVVDTADLLARPADAVQELFAFLDLGWHSSGSSLWRALGARSQSGAPSATPPQDVDAVTATDAGLATVLRRLGASLLVSTYQSNRLMALREDRGALGVHLRAFERPMGIGLTPDGIALGTRSEVWDFRDFPAAARDLEPRGRHDACFLPRNSHVTGDIAVHDLGHGKEGLWVVATRFSCLATLDAGHSFVPRWRPPFVSALAAEDRCHLNGLALVDGVPGFVTALGRSDEPGGWRRDKVAGGVVMEVPSGRVVVDGLAMPHSPRWHDGRLWVLDSGRGRLLACDHRTGETETVAELPGFTRGLRFLGHTAFVGTSQVRETATFGGLPVAALPRRECGVWAVDVRTGSVTGSVVFDSRIQELFDVAVLPGRRFPEVAEPGGSLARDVWVLPPRTEDGPRRGAGS